jgi:cytochrome c553
MKRLWLLSAAVALALAGCGEKAPEAKKAQTTAAAKPTGDAAAGRALAEAHCKSCHGLDGKAVAPGIPHLAGQSLAYLQLALREYREGKRAHAVLRGIAQNTPEGDLNNIAAYYASLPPIPTPDQPKVPTPYEEGKTAAAACTSCHGEDGNSKTPGIPSLAGQQPRYLVVATQEYLSGERKTSPMHAKIKGLTKRETENVALYFSSQAPIAKTTASGDAKAGEALAGVCGGCHGPTGISIDTATPKLASQDEKYLVEAIKAYRTSRKRENMRVYITGLNEKDIANIAAFYATQPSKPAEVGKTLVEDLTAKCSRCHAPGARPDLPIPRLAGQDRDYLVMALRAYRDDRRESSTMHKMSLPYGDSIIESLATFYATQK